MRKTKTNTHIKVSIQLQFVLKMILQLHRTMLQNNEEIQPGSSQSMCVPIANNRAYISSIII